MDGITVMSRADVKRALLDCVTDGELAVLIDHLEHAHACLSARRLVAPADADDRAQALVVDVTLADFRAEVKRRAGLAPTQRAAERIARKA